MTAKNAEISKRGVQPSSARFAFSAVDFPGSEDGALRSCLASHTLRRPAALDPAWGGAPGAMTHNAGNDWAYSDGTAGVGLLRAIENRDHVVRYRYRLDNGTTEDGAFGLLLRADLAEDYVFVVFTREFAGIAEYIDETEYVRAFDGDIDSTLGQWYEVLVVADGSHVEVWRAEAGEPLELAFETDAMEILSGPGVGFFAGEEAVVKLDDVVFETDDHVTTWYAHNGGNESECGRRHCRTGPGRCGLPSPRGKRTERVLAMTEGDVFTAYTYDAWGRTVTKQRTSAAATHQATFGYSFGQRLKWVTTDFPGEESATYNYDGLGKRRNKLVNGDATWFRWDAGWNMIAEYDGGAVQTDWDPGNLEMSYIPGLAQVPGANPATGAFAYFMTDHLGSVRGVYDQDRYLLGQIDYTPFGTPFFFRCLSTNVISGGLYLDQETNYYYTLAGHYDSKNVTGFAASGDGDRWDQIWRHAPDECHRGLEQCLRMFGYIGAMGIAHCLSCFQACYEKEEWQEEVNGMPCGPPPPPDEDPEPDPSPPPPVPEEEPAPVFDFPFPIPIPILIPRIPLPELSPLPDPWENGIPLCTFDPPWF